MQTNNSVKETKNRLSSLPGQISLHLPHLYTFLAFQLPPKMLQQKSIPAPSYPEKKQLAIDQKATHIRLNEKMLIKFCHFLFRFHFLHCFTSKRVGKKQQKLLALHFRRSAYPRRTVAKRRKKKSSCTFLHTTRRVLKVWRGVNDHKRCKRGRKRNVLFGLRLGLRLRPELQH